MMAQDDDPPPSRWLPPETDRAPELPEIERLGGSVTIAEFRALSSEAVDALFSLEAATVVSRRYQITPHDGEPRASWKRRVVEASHSAQTRTAS